MKIAILSDIHSNFTYLQSVEKEIIGKVDSIIFLGDAVGYYDSPNEVIKWLKDNEAVCIKGNHEKYLLGELNYLESKDKYYRISEQKKIITDSNIDWISSWPDYQELQFNNHSVYISHSGFDDIEKYCRTNLDLIREKVSGYDYYLFGHTHIQWMEYYYGTCILNPGSIGQPRDHSQMISYAIVDFDQRIVNLYKKEINYTSYVNKLKSNNYERISWEVLERSRS
jgi:putative phosphoesterase